MIVILVNLRILPGKNVCRPLLNVCKRSRIKSFKRKPCRHSACGIAVIADKIRASRFIHRRKLNEYVTVTCKIITDTKRCAAFLVAHKHPASGRISGINFLHLSRFSLVGIYVDFHTRIRRYKNTEKIFRFLKAHLKFLPDTVRPYFRSVHTNC